NAALPHLSAEKNQALYGRFNKWAAKALLANVYLNAEVYAGESKWNEVIAECNDIINSGVYRLDEYRSIFKTVNDGSPEIIFAVPFDENLATGLSTHLYSWHGALNRKVNMQSTPWGSGSAMGITQFIDTYDQDDQRLEDTWLMGPQYALDGVTPLLGTYDQAGKHLIFTKELPDGMYTGEAEGYRMNKFEVKVGAMGSLSNDIPFFRYAQVLLMKAEGLLRTGKQDERSEEHTSELQSRENPLFPYTTLFRSYDQAGKHLIFTKELPDGMYTGEAEGYRMNKFEVKVGAMGSLSNDIPFFRYAQVLLMKAEGLLRTGKQDE